MSEMQQGLRRVWLRIGSFSQMVGWPSVLTPLLRASSKMYAWGLTICHVSLAAYQHFPLTITGKKPFLATCTGHWPISRIMRFGRGCMCRLFNSVFSFSKQASTALHTLDALQSFHSAHGYPIFDPPPTPRRLQIDFQIVSILGNRHLKLTTIKLKTSIAQMVAL